MILYETIHIIAANETHSQTVTLKLIYQNTF